MIDIVMIDMVDKEIETSKDRIRTNTTNYKKRQITQSKQD